MNKNFLNPLLEILSVTAVLLGILIVSLNFNQLPEKIPSHFAFNGIPDAFDQKSAIWLLPVLGGMIYIVLTFVGLLNKFMKRNDEKTVVMMGMVRSMILQLKLIFSLIFLSLITGTILISMGEAKGLGIASTPTFLILLGLALSLNIWRIVKAQRPDR